MKKVIVSVLLLTLAFSTFPKAAQAVTISPLVVELQGNPGQTLETVMKVYNDKDHEITVDPLAEAFAGGDEEGNPVFIDPKKVDPDLKEKMLDWISFSKDPVTIKPKEWVDIPMKINIPPDATPGGHYVALFVSQRPIKKSDEDMLAIATRAGTLFILRVAGDIEEKGKLLDFNVEGNKKFFAYLPIKFIWRFENEGNIHVKPRGNVHVDNVFWKKDNISLNINPAETGGNTLPHSIRRYTVEWYEGLKPPADNFFAKAWHEAKHFKMGRYKSRLEAAFGQSNQKIASQVVTFWIIPWHLLVLVLAALIIILLVLRFVFVGYKRRIIKKYQKNQGKQ